MQTVTLLLIYSLAPLKHISESFSMFKILYERCNVIGNIKSINASFHFAFKLSLGTLYLQIIFPQVKDLIYSIRLTAPSHVEHISGCLHLYLAYFLNQPFPGRNF